MDYNRASDPRIMHIYRQRTALIDALKKSLKKQFHDETIVDAIDQAIILLYEKSISEPDFIWPDNPLGWVHNTAIFLLKNESRRIKKNMPIDDLKNTLFVSETTAKSLEDSSEVKLLSHSLKEEYWDVLKSYYLDEKTIPKIAEGYNRSIHAVYHSLERARKSAQKILLEIAPPIGHQAINRRIQNGNADRKNIFYKMQIGWRI